VPEDSWEEWMAALGARPDVTTTARLILTTLMKQPERASYASAGEVAALVGVNIGSVTRAAQSFGFAGWPAFREELRRRYLTLLGLRHEESPPPPGTNSAIDKSFDADLRALSATMGRADRSVISAAVADFAEARTRLAVGGGNFACAAKLLASYTSFGGYATVAPSEGADLINSVGRLQEGDFVVAFSLWLLYEGTVTATEIAHERGAKVCVITDHQPSALTAFADHVISISAEGGAFYPTMAPTIAVINAFCAELASIDPDRVQESVDGMEALWRRAKALRSPSSREAGQRSG
jgi:DNA-binding MurR/RpiR family transcriptional regulator